MAGCLSDNAIADLIDGRLSGAERVEAQEHLDSCDSCRELVADAARTSTLQQAPAAEAPLPAGAQVGRYRIVGVLGGGGMGVVYEAHDPELDRAVALKLLRARAEATELQVRLLREAQAMARLSHPNVIPVFDVGSWEGRVFVAMERMRGGTLAGWLRERPRTRREILAVFRRAAGGLQAAHDAGLLHRDFKPDNVLVDGDNVRVTDFGLARRAGEGDEEPRVARDGPLDVALTRTGSLVGTPAYMAPEQLDGRPLDARADVFSFSVALWEALFGARPFAGNSLAELRAAIVRGPTVPPGARVPGWLRRRLAAGLAEDPAQRPAGVRALCDAIDARATRSRRVLLVAAGLGAAAIAAVATLRDPCSLSLGGVWSDARRAHLEKIFAASPAGAEVFRSTAAALDGYIAAWSALRDQSCRSHEPPAVKAARLRCLQARLDETGALVDLFEHADADLVTHATDAANGLTPLEGCADTQALASLAPAPADHRRLDAVHRRVAAAQAQLATGRAPVALAESASADARELKWRPLEAEAGYTLGRAYEKAARYPEAAAALESALWAAEAGRADELKAEIAMFSAAVLSRWLYRVDEAHARERQADAALERLGPRPLLHATFENYLGMTALNEQRLPEAEQHLRRALALVGHADELRRAQLLANLSEVLIEQGHLDDAEAAARESLPVLEQRLGVHTDVAVALERLAGVLVDRGRFADALPPAERALAVRERLLGPKSARLAFALSPLGNALRGLGRFDEAERHHRRAVELQPADSIELALSLDELGADLQAAGRLDAAWDAFTRAAAIREKKLPPDDADRRVSLCRLSEVLLQLLRLPRVACR